MIPHLLYNYTFLDFSIDGDHPEGSLTVHDPLLLLVTLGELEEGHGFETHASSDD